MKRYDEQLPKEVYDLLTSARQKDPHFEELIREGGYVPPIDYL